MEQDALQSLIGSVLNTKLAQWLKLNNDVFYTYKTKYFILIEKNTILKTIDL